MGGWVVDERESWRRSLWFETVDGLFYSYGRMVCSPKILRMFCAKRDLFIPIRGEGLPCFASADHAPKSCAVYHHWELRLRDSLSVLHYASTALILAAIRALCRAWLGSFMMRYEV